MNTGRSILVIGGLVLALAACAQPPADQASTPQRSQAGVLITAAVQRRRRRRWWLLIYGRIRPHGHPLLRRTGLRRCAATRMMSAHHVPQTNDRGASMGGDGGMGGSGM